MATSRSMALEDPRQIVIKCRLCHMTHGASSHMTHGPSCHMTQGGVFPSLLS